MKQFFEACALGAAMGLVFASVWLTSKGWWL